jgi:hypothetical protein
MATLSGTVLSNCSYIPSFIPSGTSMTFENASAPTSWTKSTTHHDKTLRIVNGTVAPGGGPATFSNVFSLVASSPATVPSVQSGYTHAAAAASLTTGPTSVPFSFDNALADLPAHTHPYQYNSPLQRALVTPTAQGPFLNLTTLSTSSTGSDGQHTHTGGTYAHSHGTTSPHSHPQTETSHTHPFSTTQQDFRVYYRDIIIANKD